MSDNTSDTTSGTEAGVAEPSMEDILASIRRIIAEDDVADQGHLDVGGVPAEADIPDVTPLNFDESLDDSILDLTEDLEIPEIAVEAEFNPVSNVVSDLEDKLSSEKAETNIAELTDDLPNDLADDFEDIDLLAPSKPVEDTIDTELNDVLDLSEFTDEDTSNSVFDNLTDDLVIEEEPVEIVDFAADEAEELLDDAVEMPAANLESADINEFDMDAESDLDLVKSLMADLTDDSFLEDETEDAVAKFATESDDAVFDSVEEFDVEDSILEELDASLDVTEDVDAAEQDQILNDILDMALQGEEENNVIENDFDLTVDQELAIPDPEESAEDLLLQIAEAAEADAEIDEAAGILDVDNSDESADEILEELDMVLNEFSEEETAPIEEEHEVETADMFVEPEAAPEPAEQENDEMAKTARNDAILNEIEETAAAGAFASLTKAVEDKAVITESGPRIGELVQDALRPMLKEWLDENLKSIVERAVAKEVKRISSGK